MNISIFNKKNILFLLGFSGLIFICFANNALALSLTDSGSLLEKAAGYGGFDTEQTSPHSLVAVVVRAALSLLGVIFLILMVYGGYLWMTDRGNSDQVERAKKLISAAIIGLIIVVAAYAISFFILAKITEPVLK